MDEAFSPQTATKVIFEPPHIHIDVHVHLDGGVVAAPLAGERKARDLDFDARREVGVPAKRPLLATLVVAIGVAAVGYVGFRAGSVSSQSQAPAVSAAVAPQASPAGPAGPAGSEPLPEALARELQRPPRIIPPAEASTDAKRQSGPAAFGLQD